VQAILARRVMEANGAARILDSDASYLQEWPDTLSMVEFAGQAARGVGFRVVLVARLPTDSEMVLTLSK